MARRKFKLRLRTRLLIYILSATAVVYVGALVYIVFQTEKALVEESTSFVRAATQKNANQVKDDLDIDITICRAVASAYMGYQEIPRKQRVEIYNEVLKNVLENDDHFVSFWVSWELNAIDPDYTREHGRERYTYYRQNGNMIYQEEVLETDGGEVGGVYYDIKANPKEIITEPYFYSYTGNTSDQILEASVAVPIMDDGEFVGLVGADIELERFHTLINQIRPFENAYAVLVSNQGNIVSHPNPELINTPLAVSELGGINSDQITANIRTGKSFFYETTIQDGNTYYVSFAPFEVGNTGTPWFVGILVPKNVILAKASQLTWISVIVGLIGLMLIALIIRFIANRITTPLQDTTKILNSLSKGVIDEETRIRLSGRDEISEMAQALNKVMVSLKNASGFATEIGKGNLHIQFDPLGDQDMLGNALLKMRKNLVELRSINEKNSWMQDSILKVSETLQGEKSPSELADESLSVLAGILKFNIASLFLEEEGIYKLIGSYAYNVRKSNANEFKAGKGLIGQAVLEKKSLIFTDVPDDYISIKSGLGETTPSNILVVPLVFQKEVVAVLEVGSVKAFTKEQLELMEQISENLAIAFNSIKVREEMKVLLVKTQEQAEELRVQQEELREANEELETQTKALKASEEELQEQQEELRVTNEELEEKTKSLEQQKSEISEKNLQLENTRKDLERKAEELAVASKYKSEFLANMSHELRTPLNSLLILSQSLADNKEGNLNEDQVESAEIIQKSGTDLLNMINDILDLSKIESGKMVINFESVELESVSNSILQYFKHLTSQKGIDFSIDISDDLPARITTDQQKLEQIIKNFVSNAIKFTSEGSVKVIFRKPDAAVDLQRSGLDPGKAIAISVIDTGIGIPKDKQLEIFEAFQQVDGSTSRLYGGTGLGLSISRELAKILGGEIQLESELDKGSTFTLFLPLDNKGGKSSGVSRQKAFSKNETVKNEARPAVKAMPDKDSAKEAKNEKAFIKDDREQIGENDEVILIIEDDPAFARILAKQCHDKGFKCLATPNGEEGFEMARKYKPHALILDIKLPGISGWQVLDLLKNEPATRHIPVHIMSGEEENLDAYKKGAIGYLTKPIKQDDLNNAFSKLQNFIKRKMSSLLVVEDDVNLRKSIKKLIGQEDVKITDASNGEDAFQLIKENKFDCVVLDLGLPDMSGFELIKKLDKEISEKPPIIIYTGKDLTKEENEELQKYAETVIIKGVKSDERLVDETALFLHRVVENLPEKQQGMIERLYKSEDIFRDKKVMLVDDDMRNVFALTKVLNEKGIKVIRAENGKAALDMLEKEKEIDLILMDIMMPVMDGYETIKNIRKIKQFDKVPIIALTAKAMKEDREKCINAGANDYMTKPIKVDKLLSLMRVWLYK